MELRELPALSSYTGIAIALIVVAIVITVVLASRQV